MDRRVKPGDDSGICAAIFFAPDAPTPYISGDGRPIGEENGMSIDEIIENFALLEEWDDRYRYLIELGRGLAPLPEDARNAANKVQGCASQVWLSTSVKPNGADGP